MARGWASKSIESQVESAGERKTKAEPRRTPEEIEAQARRDSLLLHRTRVLHDLERCRGERYRETLLEGLAYLESRLAELGWRREEPE